jgi:hemerythrin-like domain-containing protein
MLPAGPLMVEHRLIERMVDLLVAEERKISKHNLPDTDFLLGAADFFRTYADRCHHGKEEDILFKELETKVLADEHTKILNELKEEHTTARTNVRRLTDARQRLLEGVAGSAEEVQEVLGILTALYPIHIEKEDRHFFLPVMDYFTKKEQLDMLHRFWEFDEKLIHNIYKDIVLHHEKLSSGT